MKLTSEKRRIKSRGVSVLINQKSINFLSKSSLRATKQKKNVDKTGYGVDII